MSTPAERFGEVVLRPERLIPLDLAWALLTVQARPDLEAEALVARLDEVAAGVRVPTLDGLVAHLFGDLGFAGNTEDYYDPRNSYLDAVLDRRLGIPITLAVLTVEVGRRVGVPVRGVGLPGHFLVRDQVDRSVFIDVFAGGTRLGAKDCEAIFRRLHGDDAPFSPTWLEPVGARSILARMLANLVRVFEDRRDQRGLLWALDLRTRLPEASAADRQALLDLQARQN
jgi:regulator of sirC expression with transglutaminase-like and TPR domain